MFVCGSEVGNHHTTGFRKIVECKTDGRAPTLNRAAVEPCRNAPVTLNQYTHGGSKTETKPQNLAPIF